MYISGVSNMNVFASYMDKYNYAKSQNVYKYILHNLIIFYKCLSKNLRFITIINFNFINKTQATSD